jgi:hypothetical protein
MVFVARRLHSDRDRYCGHGIQPGLFASSLTDLTALCGHDHAVVGVHRAHGQRGNRVAADGTRNWSFGLVMCGLGMAACSSMPGFDSFKPKPTTTVLLIQSNPASAEARSSLGGKGNGATMQTARRRVARQAEQITAPAKLPPVEQLNLAERVDTGPAKRAGPWTVTSLRRLSAQPRRGPLPGLRSNWRPPYHSAPGSEHLTVRLGFDVPGLDDRPPFLDLSFVVCAERFCRLLLARWDYLTQVC